MYTTASDLIPFPSAIQPWCLIVIDEMSYDSYESVLKFWLGIVV